MQKHTKIYFEAFGYDTEDNSVFVPSELSNNKAVDLHHIIGRGKKGEDRIENLMALTRQEHDNYGDRKYLMATLLKIHRLNLMAKNIDFDHQWFLLNISKYED